MVHITFHQKALWLITHSQKVLRGYLTLEKVLRRITHSHKSSMALHSHSQKPYGKSHILKKPYGTSHILKKPLGHITHSQKALWHIAHTLKKSYGTSLTSSKSP
jgi:hypothetical protein